MKREISLDLRELSREETVDLLKAMIIILLFIVIYFFMNLLKA